MTEARNTVKPTEPWRQRLIRSLLYGRNVDRAAKARARVGLAMVAFGVVYGIIAVRLVMFPIIGDTHGERRATRDAIATARPDIVDRNGAVEDFLPNLDPIGTFAEAMPAAQSARAKPQRRSHLHG